MLATHLLEPSFDGEERGVSRGAAIATDSASSRGAVGDEIGRASCRERV